MKKLRLKGDLILATDENTGEKLIIDGDLSGIIATVTDNKYSITDGLVELHIDDDELKIIAYNKEWGWIWNLISKSMKIIN